jgi:pilus assembly protein CpaE
MLTMIVGTDDALGLQLIGSLDRAGVPSQRDDLVSVEAARIRLKTGAPVDLVLVATTSSDQLPPAVRALRGMTVAPLIGISRSGPTQTVLEVIRAGADDYLDAANGLDKELVSLLSRLRETRLSQNSRGKSICIAAASGGCGRSTLAVNLAASLASPGNAACLIDLNVRGGDLATHLNLRAQHTIVDLCFQGQRLDETMFQHALLPHPANMALLAAPGVIGDHAGWDSEVVAQVFELARSFFPIVVTDLEDVVHREQARAVRDCDLLIVALRLDFPCILRTRRLLDYLRESGVEVDKLRVVVNRFGGGGDLPQRKAVEALGVPIFHCIPDDPTAVMTSINVGNPVVLEAPQSKVAKSFQRLAELLVNK